MMKILKAIGLSLGLFSFLYLPLMLGADPDTVLVAQLCLIFGFGMIYIIPKITE